jgi:predicted acyltransferase
MGIVPQHGQAPVGHLLPATQSTRMASIDALRGFVMFMMIFVNDLAGAGKIVPDWMVHFSDRHHGGSGMTFVDLVFPAFLFIVGLSVPFALGGRMTKGQPVWRIFGHITLRTVSLLFIGILMVHETPDSSALGWSGDGWCVLMYLSAIAAFCSISPGTSTASKWASWRVCSLCLRLGGLAALVWLAFEFRGAKGQRIITLVPFSLDTGWYGILGLIGWAYVVTSMVFLVFKTNRTAILGCVVLLMCLFAADKTGTFAGFWLNKIVGIGGTLGSLASIAVAGSLLGSMLVTTEMTALKARTQFTMWFVAGCAAAALLLNRSYGISKNNATPSWCLWASAISAVLWYGFYLISDVRPVRVLSRPLELAGQNVLLAYLVSEMLPGLLQVLQLGDWYGNFATSLPSAIVRSAGCAALVLLVSTGLNRVGFRLKL